MFNHIRMGLPIGGYNTSAVKLLLHMNGTNGSTTFTDSSATARAVTAVGTAQISTAQYKFGGASGLFDGNSDYLTVPDHDDWNFGADPFTIDTWVYFNNVPVLTVDASDSAGLWGQYVDATHYIVFQIQPTLSGGTLKHSFDLHVVDGAVDVTIIGAYYTIGGVGSTFSPTTWYHIALIRGWAAGANTWMVTVNGAQAIAAAVTSATTMPNIATTPKIGAADIIGSTHYLNGHLDEYRVTKGMAQWTSAFVPPSAPYV